MNFGDQYLNPNGSEPEWLSEFKRCKQWMEDALEYCEGAYSIEDILDSVATNQMQLWPGETSAIVGSIVVYPRRKMYHILLAGGNLQELEKMLHSIVEFAKFIGCQTVILSGRRGWERSFVRDFGFKSHNVIMKMEI